MSRYWVTYLNSQQSYKEANSAYDALKQCIPDGAKFEELAEGDPRTNMIVQSTRSIKYFKVYNTPDPKVTHIGAIWDLVVAFERKGFTVNMRASNSNDYKVIMTCMIKVPFGVFCREFTGSTVGELMGAFCYSVDNYNVEAETSMRLQAMANDIIHPRSCANLPHSRIQIEESVQETAKILKKIAKELRSEFYEYL